MLTIMRSWVRSIKHVKFGCAPVTKLAHFVYNVLPRMRAEELLFMSCKNPSTDFFAMIDSGAQINLISKNVAYHCTSFPSPSRQKIQISGVGGTKTRVIEWVYLPVEMPSGQKCNVEAAVYDEESPTVIFGMPFLRQVRARVDFVNDIMDTANGPVVLHRLLRFKKHINAMTIGVEVLLESSILTECEKKNFLELLSQFEMCWVGRRRGKCLDVHHQICLTRSQPLVTKARTYPLDHRRAIEEEIKQMLSDGVIRPSCSAYSSEVVMVKKKTGEWRMCIDYRKLNEHTVPDSYPLPGIPELLRSVNASKYFVALDLRSGYWQIPMEKDSIPLTAFRVPGGLYEFVVMPFGLKNAPATFQRAMDFLLGDLKHNGVSVYLDDILIHAETAKECMERVAKVLGRLQLAGLTINLEKCSFFPKRLEYLGHVLEDGRLLPNPKRVKSLGCIRPAKDVTELRSILGMFGYYQSFIPNYAHISAVLTDALKNVPGKRTKIMWTDDMTKAVRRLASELQKAVLQIPLETDEFLLETDASDRAIAGVLSVKKDGKWVPVEFMSKKLGETQFRWPIREKEAYAIVHSLRKFDHFLRARPFTVHTDHQSLKWLMQASTGKIARWASRMAEYDMKIIWKKGKDIQHVDFFSRQIGPEEGLEDRMVYAAAIQESTLPTIEDVLKAQSETSRPTDRGFFTKGNVTYYRNGVWVPRPLRTRIIACCHLLPPFCHPGVKKTKSTILKVFNWPNLHEDVTAYVRACLPCQRLRPGIERLQGLFRTHPVPGPFDVVYIDIWHCRFNKEPRHALTMIDLSTRWAEVEPLVTHRAEEIADVFLRVWICRFGVPKVIVTDNEKGFSNGTLQRLAATLGTTQLRTTPYHPQGNAPIESFHRRLNQRLSFFDYDGEDPTPFATALQIIMWSYRTVLHSTTRESPAFLVYGMDLRPPYHQDWRFSPPSERERIRFLNMMREDIRYQAFQRAQHDNLLKNARRLPRHIEEGQLVLSRMTPSDMRISSTMKGRPLKMQPSWSLPGRIVKVYPGGQKGVIRDILSGKTKDVHISDIRPIDPPQDARQRALWEQSIQNEFGSVFDDKKRTAAVDQFWQDVQGPAKKLRD